MIIPGQSVKIVIATKPVDFRKGHDGLAALVQSELGLDPHSGIIVVFRAKRGDRLKILLWDGSGLVLIYKRLEAGNFACNCLPSSSCPPCPSDSGIVVSKSARSAII